MQFLLNKIFILFTFIRGYNCFIASFAVWVGAHTSGFYSVNLELLYAIFGVFLITGAGNTSNDIADIKIDKKFKSDRIIPSGTIKINTAWIITTIFFLTGILLSIFIGTYHIIVSVFVTLLLLLYNFYFKRIPILGNITVALLSGLPFVYGGLLSNNWKWSIIPFMFAFLIHLGREIIKSIEDMDGDTKSGVKTIAAYVPAKKLKVFVSFLFLIVAILSVIPYVLNWYNDIYLTVLILGVLLPMIYIQSLLFGKNFTENITKIHQILKIQMLAGTVAILMAK